MPHTLADLPLEFRPKKVALTAVLAMIILIEIVFAAHFVMTSHWPASAYVTTGLISTLSFLFMVGACAWGVSEVQGRKDRIFIDETGVSVHLNGVERHYPWAKMARFHLVLVHARTNLRKVAIELQGESAFDAKANVIWPRFGPPTDDFLALLRAGKARWGPESQAS